MTDAEQKTGPATWRSPFAIAAVTLTPIALIGFIAARVGVGDTRKAAAPLRLQGLDTTGHFLVAVAVILTVATIGGLAARRLGQPSVIGEICAGLAMGPTLLGHTAPEAADWLFPAPVLPMVNALSQLGLVLFMFGVGRELTGVRVRNSTGQALLVSQASLLIPFAAGTVVALPLLGRFAGAGHRLSFVLFIGCALSITAFPVLARILMDLRITDTPAGQLSLLVAALGDGGGWLVLAGILTLDQGSGPTRLLVSALLAVVTVAVLLGPLRRVLARRWQPGSPEDGEHTERLHVTVLVLLTVGVTAASALTAAIGLHQLIGALLVGVAWPSGNQGVTAIADRVVGTVSPLLLPFFFFSFGLSINLGALSWNGTTLLALAALLFTAVVAKVAGPSLCAVLTGMPWRPALALGVLLNARGLTELVVLQIGYQAGIIDQALLGILTIVALTTTAMTGPLLRRVGFVPPPRSPVGGDREPRRQESSDRLHRESAAGPERM